MVDPNPRTYSQIMASNPSHCANFRKWECANYDYAQKAKLIISRQVAHFRNPQFSLAVHPNLVNPKLIWSYPFESLMEGVLLIPNGAGRSFDVHYICLPTRQQMFILRWEGGMMDHGPKPFPQPQENKPMSDCMDFEEFSNTYGAALAADVLQFIMEEVYDHLSGQTQQLRELPSCMSQLHFSDISNHSYQHNIRYEISGSVLINNVEFCFEIEDGNGNGTVVKSWEGKRAVKTANHCSDFDHIIQNSLLQGQIIDRILNAFNKGRNTECVESIASYDGDWHPVYDTRSENIRMITGIYLFGANKYHFHLSVEPAERATMVKFRPVEWIAAVGSRARIAHDGLMPKEVQTIVIGVDHAKPEPEKKPKGIDWSKITSQSVSRG